MVGSLELKQSCSEFWRAPRPLCRLLAVSLPDRCSASCPLLRGKRTRAGCCSTSVYDPFRKSFGRGKRATRPWHVPSKISTSSKPRLADVERHLRAEHDHASTDWNDAGDAGVPDAIGAAGKASRGEKQQGGSAPMSKHRQEQIQMITMVKGRATPTAPPIVNANADSRFASACSSFTDMPLLHRAPAP
jgi:hypothetical protein